MRKILSVVLAVVMLASLAAVMPVSAAAAELGPVITEIVVDTAGGDLSMSNADAFEFIEIYNPTDSDINLYEYALTLNDSLSVGTVPDDASFTDFTPILSPAMSKAAGNTLGTIATSKQTQDGATSETSIWPYYPINPDTAILEPGKTAVIWLYTFDAYGISYKVQNLTFQDFKDYWHMDSSDDTLIVAVDANGSNSTKQTVYDEYANKVTTSMAWKGANSADNDLMANVYSSADGRFNGANSGSRYYGIAKLADIADARTTLTHSQIESYVYVNYGESDATKNLMYKYSGGQSTGSNLDVSYNFTYTTAASEYAIGKVEGVLKYGDWLSCQYATPGKLLPQQAADFEVLGFDADASVIGHDKEDTITTLAENHVLYSEDFESISSVYPDWEIESKLNGALNSKFATTLTISGGKLICKNASGNDNLITIIDGATLAAMTDTDSTSADYNKKLAYANLLLEYDIQYTSPVAGKSDRYAGVVYNFDGNMSYGIFILRIQGKGNNHYRYRSVYLTHDVAGQYFAANDDTVAGNSSIISKLTDGKIYAASTSTSAESMRLVNLDQVLHVKIYIDQTYGPSLYVNDILVSTPVNTAIWGVQRENGDLGLGLFVSQYVNCEIDNIKLTALAEDNNVDDAFLAEKAAQYKLENPETGDVTIYVAIAMAVSFVSLAALVIVKRKKNVTE